MAKKCRIRTCQSITPLKVFKTAAIDRSANSPFCYCLYPVKRFNNPMGRRLNGISILE